MSNDCQFTMKYEAPHLTNHINKRLGRAARITCTFGFQVSPRSEIAEVRMEWGRTGGGSTALHVAPSPLSFALPPSVAVQSVTPTSNFSHTRWRTSKTRRKRSLRSCFSWSNPHTCVGRMGGCYHLTMACTNFFLGPHFRT